ERRGGGRWLGGGVLPRVGAGGQAVRAAARAAARGSARGAQQRRHRLARVDRAAGEAVCVCRRSGNAVRRRGCDDDRSRRANRLRFFPGQARHLLRSRARTQRLRDGRVIERGRCRREMKSKVLIFIVAYQTESTLDGVLKRIPPLAPDLDVEVLVIDDGSSDRTFEVGLRSLVGAERRVTVLFNPTNQGYGGNQKLGYAYAIRNGFDFVVLLHGDRQYAPP